MTLSHQHITLSYGKYYSTNSIPTKLWIWTIENIWWNLVIEQRYKYMEQGTYKWDQCTKEQDQIQTNGTKVPLDDTKIQDNGTSCMAQTK